MAKWKIIQPRHEVLYIMSMFVPKLASLSGGLVSRFTKFFLSTWICFYPSVESVYLPSNSCHLFWSFHSSYKWIHFLNWITSQFLPWNCWKFLQTAWYRRLKDPACPILSHLQLLSILPSLWDRNISGRSCRGDAMANPQKFHTTIFSESVAQLWPHLKFWKQGSDLRWFLKFKDDTTSHCLHAISYSKGAINAHGRVLKPLQKNGLESKSKVKTSRFLDTHTQTHAAITTILKN